jgi:amidase
MSLHPPDPFASATQLVAALDARSVSARDLAELYIGRIERLDGPVNAVVVRDFERARAAADASDRRRAEGSAGRLEGVPMTIKESFNVSGLPTTCGIVAASGFVSAHDALVVARARAAGAVVLGKTNVPVMLSDWQSANPIYGRTANPWDRSLTPGGSSGGSAAAIACGFSALEIGSDIGGSIRVPAAYCGVFGHRPSDSALPRSGQFPAPPTAIHAMLLGVQGPIARSAADLELALDVLAGAELAEAPAWRIDWPAPRQSRLDRWRVGVLRTPDWVPVEPAIEAALDRFAGDIAKTGAHVGDAAPVAEAQWRDAYRLYNRLLGAVIGARMTPEARAVDVEALERHGDEFALAYVEGLRASVSQFFGWLIERERLRAAWRSLFEACDVVVAPVILRQPYAHVPFEGSPIAAAAALEIDVAGRKIPYGRPTFHPALATLPGLPATAIPVGLDDRGLPVGLQLIGPYLEDRSTIALAAQLERAGLAAFRPPPGFDEVPGR